jgi:hypothetical protein
MYSRYSSALFDVLKGPFTGKIGGVVPGFMNPLFDNVLVAEYFNSDPNIL